MFTSKKDDQIETLEKQIQMLSKEIQSFKKRLANCQTAFDEKVAELISAREERTEMQEYYSIEDARLRRMVASEKKQRINNKNANERKIRKLIKALESQEFIE